MPNLPRQEVVICNLQELVDTISGGTNTEGCQCAAELAALGVTIVAAITDMKDALLNQLRIQPCCCFCGCIANRGCYYNFYTSGYNNGGDDGYGSGNLDDPCIPSETFISSKSKLINITNTQFEGFQGQGGVMLDPSNVKMTSINGFSFNTHLAERFEWGEDPQRFIDAFNSYHQSIGSDVFMISLSSDPNGFSAEIAFVEEITATFSRIDNEARTFPSSENSGQNEREVVASLYEIDDCSGEIYQEARIIPPINIGGRQIDTMSIEYYNDSNTDA